MQFRFMQTFITYTPLNLWNIYVPAGLRGLTFNKIHTSYMFVKKFQVFLIHIFLSVMNDEELAKYWENVWLALHSQTLFQ